MNWKYPRDGHERTVRCKLTVSGLRCSYNFDFNAVMQYSAFFLISTKATKDNIKITRGLITDETTGQYYEKYIKYFVLRSNP